MPWTEMRPFSLGGIVGVNRDAPAARCEGGGKLLRKCFRAVRELIAEREAWGHNSERIRYEALSRKVGHVDCLSVQVPMDRFTFLTNSALPPGTPASRQCAQTTWRKKRFSSWRRHKTAQLNCTALRTHRDSAVMSDSIPNTERGFWEAFRDSVDDR